MPISLYINYIYYYSLPTYVCIRLFMCDYSIGTCIFIKNMSTKSLIQISYYYYQMMLINKLHDEKKIKFKYYVESR